MQTAEFRSQNAGFRTRNSEGIRLFIIAAIIGIAVSGAAHAQTAFTFAGRPVQPGTMIEGALEVVGASGQPGTTVPYTVAHGVRPGPVLALTAGVHGQEYTPILALQRLRAALDPRRLAGTVIMVHVANMPSFLGRTIYYSPVDGKNLNRVFPGRADGTLSERIAHAITQHVIAPATHVIDLHCGDGNESLRPYTYWMIAGASSAGADAERVARGARAGVGPHAQLNEATRQMALAFGLDHIVIDRERPDDPAASVYLSNTAITRGRPALTIESGFLAQPDEASIARIERGIAGVMKHLKMQSDGPDPVANPIWIDRSEVLRSGFTGIFYPLVERGHSVAAGTLLGRVTDFHGRTLAEVKAPFAGEILYVVGTPPVSKGEPLAFVGAIAPKAP